jgi:hypothetical protein
MGAYNPLLGVKLKLQILRYVDDHFPGWVECEFTDAERQHHTVVDKVPIVSEESLGPEDEYPKRGTVRCEILERWHDSDGRDLSRITIERPDGVETKEGVSEFIVLSSQVVSAEATMADLEEKARAYEEQAKSQPNRASLLMHDAELCREWIAALRNGHWKS